MDLKDAQEETFATSFTLFNMIDSSYQEKYSSSTEMKI